MQFTYDHILTLAPDPGTAQRAKPVAHAQRWHTLEGDGRAIWGTLGDPADPYRTSVDLQGPGFRCTCPVRRLPCKHGIGLLLLFSKNNDAFRVANEPPDWVADWLKKRDERTAKPDAPAARTSEANQALAEKRRQNREKRLLQMSAGLAELESWLTDLFRQGLATLEGQAPMGQVPMGQVPMGQVPKGQAGSYFSDLAARMVDAKLGTLARRIRQLPLPMAEADWHGKLLAELGDIYLIVRAFQRLEQLPEPLQDDLLALAGVNFKKEEILALDGISDRWLVAGQTEEEEDGNLLARRTWLIGEATGGTALLLDFSWGGQGFETSWRMGTVLRGEVVFFPSAWPQRALPRNFEYDNEPFELRNGCPSLVDFADGYARALAANPWLAQFPAVLENVVPVFSEGIFLEQKNNFVLVDNERRQLPLLADEHLGWKLVALSIGRPVSVFGTWDGTVFSPLSVLADGRFQVL